jgi:hypothetical protein
MLPNRTRVAIYQMIIKYNIMAGKSTAKNKISVLFEKTFNDCNQISKKNNGSINPEINKSLNICDCGEKNFFNAIKNI